MEANKLYRDYFTSSVKYVSIEWNAIGRGDGNFGTGVYRVCKMLG